MRPDCRLGRPAVSPGARQAGAGQARLAEPLVRRVVRAGRDHRRSFCAGAAYVSISSPRPTCSRSTKSRSSATSDYRQETCWPCCTVSAVKA